MIRSTWSSGRNQLLVRWSSFVLLYIISGKWWSFLWGHLRKHIKHLFRILHHVNLISVEQMKILKQKENFNTKKICIYIYVNIRMKKCRAVIVLILSCFQTQLCTHFNIWVKDHYIHTTFYKYTHIYIIYLFIYYRCASGFFITLNLFF